MRAVTWTNPAGVTVEEVPDPVILEPTDAIVRITSTAICGSDLHLLDVLAPFMHAHDVVGHEPMGIVEEVGSAVSRIQPGDRVVVPFVIACGECFMCQNGLQSQCETTQMRETGSGASLYGYSELYGENPGGQAERMRIQRADYNLTKVGNELPDDRYLFLSDILPTAWQGVQYAGLEPGQHLTVLGLGPVGQFASRIGRHLGYDVVAVDPVPERRAMAERHGVTTLDLDDDTADALRDRTDGRGPDAVLDAVGMEAHGGAGIAFAQRVPAFLPKKLSQAFAKTAGVDRLGALDLAIEVVRRGGTISLSGVYGGVADPIPMLTLFDKQVTMRMGQCNVQRWRDELIPIVEDPTDPLGTEDLVTHRVPLEQAPELYEVFKKKEDGCVKVVLEP